MKNNKPRQDKSLDICVVGTGYVGLVTGSCLAELGHRVVCVDSDAKKLKTLRSGKVPIYEPGLDKLFHKNVKEKRLTFAPAVAQGMSSGGRRASVIFIAVGTPPRSDGSADLSAVEAVAAEIAANLKDYTVIVDKSTVPVETGEWVSKTVHRHNKRQVPYDVASNPEFLSEGSAVHDFLHPDRIVLGVSSARAEAVMRSVYAPIKAPVLVTDVKSAELIKHASNSFLATKISYINAVSVLCEKVGADVSLVAQGMGMDRRIGPMFLRPGIGFGGFCLAPDEPVILRDPAGIIKTLPIRQAYASIRQSEGVWEALSLDPKTDAMEFMPITNVSRRRYHGVMVSVSTKMGKSVRITADHPMLARSHDRWETRPASDLTTSDWLPCFLSMPSAPVAPKSNSYDRVPTRSRRSSTLTLNSSVHQMLAETAAARLALFEREPAPAGYRKVSEQAAAVRVTGADRHAYRGPVYSMEVSGHENFATPSGLILHNCFPKDLEAFYWIAKQKGYDFTLLKTVKEINEFQKSWVLRRIEEKLWNLEGKTIALLGLAFKPNTDDMRFAPSIDVVKALLERRARVRAYDPVSMPRSRELAEMKGVTFCTNPLECAAGADALALVTEWPEFKTIDLKRLRKAMRNPLILDGRNLFDPKTARAAGFDYVSVGRP